MKFVDINSLSQFLTNLKNIFEPKGSLDAAKVYTDDSLANLTADDVGVYVQSEEPVDAVEGDIWVDVDAESHLDPEIVIDATLTQSGQAADAKVVGDKIDELESELGVYVTPEMFSAVGDGVADDTAALEAAFNSGLSIMCQRDKTYKCSRQIICNETGFIFNGNGCTLLNFSVKVNLGSDYQWVEKFQTPKYMFANCIVNNRDASFNNSVIETGSPMLIQNVTFWYCKGLVTIGASYMDYIVMDHITNYEYQGTRNCITSFRSDGSYNNYVGLGDMRYFKQVHGGAGENFAFIQVDAMQPVTFNNCLNLKIQFNGAACNCNVINCHFEGQHAGFVYTNGLELPDEVKLNVRDSFLQDSCRRLKGNSVTYKGCKFVLEYQGLDRDIENNVPYIELNTEDCVLTVAPQTGGLPGAASIQLENYKGADSIGYSETFSGTLALNGYNDTNECYGRLTAGEYKYYAYLSIYKDVCIGGQGEENEVSVTVNGNQLPRFNMITRDGDVKYTDYFAHIYRVDASGNVKKAILPPDNTRYVLYDFGQTINGIKWETAAALPTANPYACLANGVVYTTPYHKENTVKLLPNNTFYYCDGALSYKA